MTTLLLYHGTGERGTNRVAHQARLAVLFADLCGSTGLYEALGDARARALVVRCTDTMAEATRRRRGLVVKTIGDAVMATFPAADAAAEAAAAMQEAITGRLVAGGRPLAIRIGFHVGAALVEEADLFGDAVNVPARLAAEAKAGQILTSGETVGEMSAHWRAACRHLALARLRGKQQPVPIFELLWTPEEATLMRPPQTAAGLLGARLTLVYGGLIAELGPLSPALTIGRAKQNDILADGPLVSRLHARIEYRQSRFVLTDMSANGTWIEPDGGAKSFLHRDSEALSGAGALGLGEAPDGRADAIRYFAPVFPPGPAAALELDPIG